MNHAGEIRPLVKMVRPHVAIVTHDRRRPSRPFPQPRRDRRRQGRDIRGHRARRRGAPQPRRCALRSCSTGWRAPPASSTSSASASMPRANFKLVECELHAGRCSTIAARIGGRRGRRRGSARRAAISCRTRWRCSARRDLVGADLDKVALALADAVGRSAAAASATSCAHAGAARSRLIDESYNANPASMKAAHGAARRARRCGRRAGASPCSATCWNSATMRPSCMPALPS